MNRTGMLAFTLLWLIPPPGSAQQPGPRARDLGIPLDGNTGPLNAITDVVWRWVT